MATIYGIYPFMENWTWISVASMDIHRDIYDLYRWISAWILRPGLLVVNVCWIKLWLNNADIYLARSTRIQAVILRRDLKQWRKENSNLFAIRRNRNRVRRKNPFLCFVARSDPPSGAAFSRRRLPHTAQCQNSMTLLWCDTPRMHCILYEYWRLNMPKPRTKIHGPKVLMCKFGISLLTNKPKVFRVKFSLRDIRRIFPLKYEILCFEKCLNY